jgi:CxxC motif-containing protein
MSSKAMGTFLYSQDLMMFLKRYGKYIKNIDPDYDIYGEIELIFHPDYLEIELETVTVDEDYDCFWITQPLIVDEIARGYFGYYIPDQELNKTKKINSKGVSEDMNITKGLTFDFGTCENDKVRMSAYGLAIKNEAGTWVSYDTKTKSIMDVDILNFECGKYLFKMPVAISAVKAGDVVIHNRVPMFVTGVSATSIAVVDIHSGEEKNIVPTKSPFGFNFLTKVISLVDFSGNKSDENNPFGNLLPFIMLNESKSGDNTILALAALAGNDGADITKNPLLLYALMGQNKGGNSDLAALLLMTQGANLFGANGLTPTVDANA